MDPDLADGSATRTADSPKARPYEHTDEQAMPDRPLAPSGKFGRYWVLREIGRGGGGRVYEAHDPHLDRRIALKVLHRTTGHGGTRSDRLLREAQALARVSHPNVVVVHEAGEIEGRSFISMELVEGISLTEWLQNCPPERRTAEETLGILRQAGEGLAAAHSAGIVHRDFKPANVLVGNDGRVRVVDFGLARTETTKPSSLGTWGIDSPSAPGARSHTTNRAGAGTPAYMAPEQLLGQELSMRTDQFAFCAVAWEAIFGSRPYPEPDASVRLRAMRRARLRRLFVPTWATGGLEEVLVRGLRYDPTRRYCDLAPITAMLEPEALGRVAPKRSRAPWLVPMAVLLAAGSAALWPLSSTPEVLTSEARNPEVFVSEVSTPSAPAMTQQGQPVETLVVNRCARTAELAIDAERPPADAATIPISPGSEILYVLPSNTRIWLQGENGYAVSAWFGDGEIAEHTDIAITEDCRGIVTLPQQTRRQEIF